MMRQKLSQLWQELWQMQKLQWAELLARDIIAHGLGLATRQGIALCTSAYHCTKRLSYGSNGGMVEFLGVDCGRVIYSITPTEQGIKNGRHDRRETRVTLSPNAICHAACHAGLQVRPECRSSAASR